LRHLLQEHPKVGCVELIPWWFVSPEVLRLRFRGGASCDVGRVYVVRLEGLPRCAWTAAAELAGFAPRSADARVADDASEAADRGGQRNRRLWMADAELLICLPDLRIGAS
jgi:hypothetical protein